MDEALPRTRHVQWLVGPLVTLVAVVALLLVARHYEHIPLRPPECSFKEAFGIPCVGCGGTRAMIALAKGRAIEAFRFNPAAVLGVAACALWLASGLSRYLLATPEPTPAEQKRRIVRNASVAAVLLFLNWIYLLLYLP